MALQRLLQPWFEGKWRYGGLGSFVLCQDGVAEPSDLTFWHENGFAEASDEISPGKNEGLLIILVSLTLKIYLIKVLTF